MSPVLRPHFGSLAGGLEHALALATLAHAVQPGGGTLPATGLPEDWRRPTTDFDMFSRLVTLLQDVVAHAGYTIDDLRREGFAEPVLSALKVSRPM
jgi:hypothetical protein